MLFGGETKFGVVVEGAGKDDVVPFRTVLSAVEGKLVDTARSDMLVVDGSVRPGVLVLINDTDWELEGQLEAEVRAGDVVTFISTLHGG